MNGASCGGINPLFISSSDQFNPLYGTLLGDHYSTGHVEQRGNKQQRDGISDPFTGGMHGSSPCDSGGVSPTGVGNARMNPHPGSETQPATGSGER